MIDVTAIASGAAAVNSLTQTAQALLRLKESGSLDAQTGSHVLELVSNAMATQAAYFALSEERNELKAKLDRYDNWAEEAGRYELHEIGTGIFVYRIKEAVKGDEPLHNICPHCYQKGFKSILQSTHLSGSCFRLDCPACKAQFVYGEPERFEYAYEPEGRL